MTRRRDITSAGRRDTATSPKVRRVKDSGMWVAAWALLTGLIAAVWTLLTLIFRLIGCGAWLAASLFTEAAEWLTERTRVYEQRTRRPLPDSVAVILTTVPAGPMPAGVAAVAYIPTEAAV